MNYFYFLLDWISFSRYFDWVLLSFTIPLLLVIAFLQYKNWRKYKDGNGADTQRIAMMFGSLAAIGTCAGVLIRDFAVVSIFVSIVPFVGLSLYVIKKK